MLVVTLAATRALERQLAVFMGPGVRRDDGLISIQREAPGGGIPETEIRRRIERLPIDRPVAVFARKRRIAAVGWIGVIHELPLAREHLGAGVEPGPFGHVSGRRPLLIDPIGPARAVIGTATLVIFPFDLRIGLR